jgi:hypothetical protein
VVLGVGHVRSPVGGALGDGEVCHEVIWRGAVPVLFAVGCEDDISGAEFDDLLPARLDEAAAFCDVEGLPAFVGVPGTSRAGREVDRGRVELGWRQAPGDGIDLYLTGEGLGGALGRGYLARDVHVCVSCVREIIWPRVPRRNRTL